MLDIELRWLNVITGLFDLLWCLGKLLTFTFRLFPRLFHFLFSDYLEKGVVIFYVLGLIQEISGHRGGVEGGRGIANDMKQGIKVKQDLLVI